MVGQAFSLPERPGRLKACPTEMNPPPINVAVHLAKLAWVEHSQGKSHQAGPHLEAAVKLDPDNPTVREVAEIVRASGRRR